MFLTTRSRSWLTVPVLIMLVASLLALSADPARGKNGEADDKPLYTACLGSVLESADFRDIVGYPAEFEKVINCMANYGIMPGLLPQRFQPGLGVTRQQMALILIRAAHIAGIEVPAPRDQGFRDIGHLSRETRDSINQLAQLRVTHGTTATTYVPDTVVNRRQMAQFFTRFLGLAPVGDGGTSVGSVIPDDTHFTDIVNLPHDPYDAIRMLYELGVTTGTTVTTYGPDDPVTRAQMAMFISRMLAHTNARPAGITMQIEQGGTSVTSGDTVDLAISLRDEDHLPVIDEPVDIFYVAKDEVGFSSNGRCSRRAMIVEGSLVCTIDVADEITDGDGNLLLTTEIDESLTLYVWSGNRDNRFDLDTTDYASIEFAAAEEASQFLLTDDLPKGATKVPFGSTVTFTFQLTDDDENPVAEEDVEIRLETIEEVDRRVVRERTRTYSTDETGRIQLSFRISDPDRDDNDRDGELTMNLIREDVPVEDKTSVEILSRDLRWSDDDDEPTRLLVEQSSIYSEASTSGGSNRVTATLVDQYGDPVRGERVHFTSDDPDGLSAKEKDMPDDPPEAQNPYRRTTSSRGVAAVSYTRDSGVSRIEMITVFTDDVTADVVLHYWVDELPDGPTTGTVVNHDDDSDTVVIGYPATVDPPDEIYAVTYDSGDQFNDSDGNAPDGPITYKEFNEQLAKGDTLEINYAGDSAGSVNRFTILP